MKGPSFLPTAAQRPVDLDHGEQLVAARADQTELGVEELTLAVEHLEVARDASAIPDVGEPGRLARRHRERLLLHAKFGALAILDEPVRDLAERLHDRLPVLRDRRLRPSLRGVYAGPDAPHVEDRHRERRTDREEALRSEHRAVERDGACGGRATQEDAR